jgi:hypothetical protein
MFSVAGAQLLTHKVLLGASKGCSVKIIDAAKSYVAIILDTTPYHEGTNRRCRHWCYYYYYQWIVVLLLKGY